VGAGYGSIPPNAAHPTKIRLTGQYRYSISYLDSRFAGEGLDVDSRIRQGGVDVDSTEGVNVDSRRNIDADLGRGQVAISSWFSKGTTGFFALVDRRGCMLAAGGGPQVVAAG